MSSLPKNSIAVVNSTRRRVIVFYSQYDEPEEWRLLFARHCPEWVFQVWSEVEDFEAVEVALVWSPQEGMLGAFPHLKLIINLGAGADSILSDQHLPSNVPIVRLSNPEMSTMMMQYVLHFALHYHRDIPKFAQAQKQHRWHYIPPRSTQHTHIGILGLGALGSFVAIELRRQGFTVSGWARSPKQIDGVATTDGTHPSCEWLGTLDILVILLPLTPQTRGLIDRAILESLPRGAKIISVGRGALVNEADLVEALRCGHLGGATVDTFGVEPLPPDHPFWTLDNLILTPHIASMAIPEACMADIVHNIEAVNVGGCLKHVVDPTAGY